ncbi:DDE-type integrase/transposase/recombinase [Cupriavidus basilensis]
MVDLSLGKTNGEALAIEIGTSIPARRLIRTLSRPIDWYGPPNSIRPDNGPEMPSHDFTQWAASKGVALRFIEPDEPNQNAYIERFKRAFYEGKEVNANQYWISGSWIRLSLQAIGFRSRTDTAAKPRSGCSIPGYLYRDHFLSVLAQSRALQATAPTRRSPAW